MKEPITILHSSGNMATMLLMWISPSGLERLVAAFSRKESQVC